MKLIDRIAGAAALARQGWSVLGSGERAAVLSESDIQNLQREDIGYAALGARRTDVPAYTQQRMQEVALGLYRSNHMAKRLLEIIIDFVLGDGVKVVARHEDEATREAIQECLDDFWEDPINEMDRKNPQRLTELNLWGEILMPVMVNDLTKRVRLGWIDPACIAGVELDPITKEPARVKLDQVAQNDVGQEYLDVIRYSHADGTIVGNCFFYQINTIVSSSRGMSEFFTSADWFDIIDETLKVESDRSKVLQEYIWDVEIEGGTPDVIAAFIKSQRRPKPGAMRVHNEKVKWQAIAPDLKAYENSRLSKDLKSYVLGGFGYPDHWFGAGGDANLATAEMMSEPTRKALKRKTRQFTFLLKDICRFVLVQAAQPSGMLAGVQNFDPLEDCFEITVPDIGGPDVAKVGAALQQITTAIGLALTSKLVTEETAREMFAAVASLTGVEIDPTAEGDKIDQASQEQAKLEQQQQEQQAQATQDALAALSKAPGAQGGQQAPMQAPPAAAAKKQNPFA